MKVIGYSWAIDEADDDAGEWEAARLSIEQYARRHRWQVRGIYLEDAREAFIAFDQRTQGRDVLRMLGRGDTLIVPDQGCLFRTASQGITILRMLQEREASVHSLDLGGDIARGKLSEVLIAILGPLAIGERQLPAERMRILKIRERSEQRYLGGKAPFGFTVNSSGELEPDRRRRAILRRMLTLRSQGHSLRAIAAAMRKERIEISHVGVANALKAAGYVESDASSQRRSRQRTDARKSKSKRNLERSRP